MRPHSAATLIERGNHANRRPGIILCIVCFIAGWFVCAIFTSGSDEKEEMISDTQRRIRELQEKK